MESLRNSFISQLRLSNEDESNIKKINELMEKSLFDSILEMMETCIKKNDLYFNAGTDLIKIAGMDKEPAKSEITQTKIKALIKTLEGMITPTNTTTKTVKVAKPKTTKPKVVKIIKKEDTKKKSPLPDMPLAKTSKELLDNKKEADLEAQLQVATEVQSLMTNEVQPSTSKQANEEDNKLPPSFEEESDNEETFNPIPKYDYNLFINSTEVRKELLNNPFDLRGRLEFSYNDTK